jgi:colanic acid/amylovoran biosynthesis glycosyltransferase
MATVQANILTVVHSLPAWLPLTSTWLHNQVRYLAPDINSHIVCERTENLDQFNVPNIHNLEDGPRWRYVLEKGLRKLRVRHHSGYLVQVAKQYQATILHSHWGDVAWRDMNAAKKAGLRHVVSFYGKDVNYLPRLQPRWLKRYQELFRHVSLVLCEGPHMGQCIVQLGCPKEKVLVHHLGVEVEKITFKPRVWTLNEPLRVLVAASFREKKGIPYALEALGLLQAEWPRLEITIIGDASADPRSHPEKAKILSVMEKYELVGKTRMLSYQPHAVLLEEAYRHHIFISPSVTASDGDTEGGAPMTLLEMAASGMPIVSTRHCDIPSVVIHGTTGLLAGERDVNALLDHLRWLVTYPEQWRAMLDAGRRHVEGNYDVVKQAGKLGAMYGSLG